MRLRHATYALILVYMALTIYTVISAYFGVRFQPFFTPFVTLVAFIFALLHGAQRLGWGRTALLLCVTFGVSLLFESVGVATGRVYGPYHYTTKLGPMFLDLVPYLIPVAWFMMTYPSYVIAARLVSPRGRLWRWRFGVAALGALVMTAWDLAMDPMMVAGGHWAWEVQGAYFGIPLQNFWGWWLTTFVTFALFLTLGRLTPSRDQARDSRFERLAVVSYAITGLSNVAINLIGGMGGPALAGLFAMLPWVVLGWSTAARGS